MTIIKNYFDILCIDNNSSGADIIQAFLGKNCLGTYFDDNTAKLYFEGGKKNDIDKILINFTNSLKIDHYWLKQNKENWHLEWQIFFKPVIINKKIAIIPHWQNNRSEKTVIKIKPGMAFGTGHHETTWLVLTQMIKYINSDTKVLDCGTGSGILSIAAKKLGAKHIDSVELDLDCKSNFLENLQLNNIQDDIIYHNLNILNLKNFNYDLILANINKLTIEKLIPKLSLSNGLIILSGLLDSDYNSIAYQCSANDLQILDVTKKGEWICLIIK